MDTISQNLDYFLFLSGFSFILLAAISFLLRNRQGERPAWGWLALFALSHGLNEWLEMTALTFAIPPGFAAARTVLLALSFISLLEFWCRSRAGRRPLFPPIYILLVPLSLAGAFYGATGFNVSVRYALGLTGCLAAALTLSRHASGRQLQERLPLILAAAALALYGLAAGAVVPKAPFPPASWLNQDSFLLLTGLPVQLFRGLLAAATAGAAWLHFLRAGVQDPSGASTRRPALGLGLLTTLCFSLALGLVITSRLGTSAGREVQGKSEIISNILVNRMLSFTGLADRTAAAMAASPGIKRAFSGGRAAIEQANRELDNFSSAYDLSICYLLDGRGVSIASSNRNTPQSLVGRSYSFRPYFKQAITGTPSQYYAVGETTGERGYYTASPVMAPGGRVEGIAAVKVDMSSLDDELMLSGLTFVASPDGIILMSSRPELLFRSLWPIGRDKQREIKESRQFGWVDFAPVLPGVPEDGRSISLEGRDFYASRSQLGGGWSFVDLQPLDQVLLARLCGILLTLSSCLILIFTFTFLMRAGAAADPPALR